MIRLGTLAGYSFEGPRLLGSWNPPSKPGVYVVVYKPNPETKPEQYAVIYVGHSENFAEEGFPFRHPRAQCWISRAGSRWRVYICTFEVTYEFTGGGQGHRELITQELMATYHPACNTQTYDKAWKEEWIGEYSADTSGLAPRGPDERPL